jgi:hypothetical protein
MEGTILMEGGHSNNPRGDLRSRQLKDISAYGDLWKERQRSSYKALPLSTLSLKIKSPPRGSCDAKAMKPCEVQLHLKLL